MKLPSHPPDYKSIVSSSPLCVSEDVLQTLHDPWSWNHTSQGDRFVQLTQTSPKPLIYICTGSSRRINNKHPSNCKHKSNYRWHIARGPAGAYGRRAPACQGKQHGGPPLPRHDSSSPPQFSGAIYEICTMLLQLRKNTRSEIEQCTNFLKETARYINSKKPELITPQWLTENYFIGRSLMKRARLEENCLNSSSCCPITSKFTFR